MEQPHLDIRNGHFVDQHGRVQIVHGVNLGGSSKLPYNYGHVDPLPSNPSASFFDGATTVSFVNRPFPLEEADLHFSRLRRWGLTFLRFIVTWEAIEHEGPGLYDRAYLAYIRAIVAKANEYELFVYIDPHQDVWSRWTGGDGAPMWTLECVGFEPRNFAATHAALCMETRGHKATEFPKMIWPTNYFKVACATMFTLFWGGKKFAPNCFVDGVQVQEYLQGKYLDALTELAKELQGLPNVVGFGTMNEPSPGYIGLEDLTKPWELKMSASPTPFQGMVLGEGIPQNVDEWSLGFNQLVRGKPDRTLHIDPHGVRAWQPNRKCVWQNEGVWRVDPTTGKPELLKPKYFAGTHFGPDCYLPFAVRFSERIRNVLPQAMTFVELPPMDFGASTFPDIDPAVLPRAVNAAHWYDTLTLFICKWRPNFSVEMGTNKLAFGRENVQKMHRAQLSHMKDFGRKQMHNAPTLIGETGIPFNMHNGEAFETNNYSKQVEALDHTISCLEANLLSYTLWNYTADNDNTYGDLWNLEDLSLVNPQKKVNDEGKHDRDACARALRAFARPHATKIAGIPLKSHFELKKARYFLEFSSADLKINKPTEIYVPHVQYPNGYTVTFSNGHFEVQHHDGWDIVLYHHDASKHHHTVLIHDPHVDARLVAHHNRKKLLKVATVLAPLIAAYCFYKKR